MISEPTTSVTSILGGDEATTYLFKASQRSRAKYALVTVRLWTVCLLQLDTTQPSTQSYCQNLEINSISAGQAIVLAWRARHNNCSISMITWILTHSRWRRHVHTMAGGVCCTTTVSDFSDSPVPRLSSSSSLQARLTIALYTPVSRARIFPCPRGSVVG